jgi:tRNA(fMet)-specific endonuclease VapC
MATLIDSSVLIAAERGNLDLPKFFSQSPDEHFAISCVTASELLHGVHRAPAEKKSSRETFVENILSHLPVLAFDLVAARIHARLWAELSEKGTPIGAHDLLIAATALAMGARVATRDERSFRRIPGLPIIIP